METTQPPAPPGTPAAPADQPRWRDDFPIDRPQDDYVARRDFVKFLVLISGAFVVGQFWIVLRKALRGGRGATSEVEIARVDETVVGGSLLFYYPTQHDPCLLIRTSDEDFVAYSNQCTHLMCPVQPEVDQGRLHCPCHVGYFDLKTGRPLAGPPRRPLPRIGLNIRDGVIYATGEEVQAR